MSDVDVVRYALKLRAPWRTASGTMKVRHGFLVRLGRSWGDAAALPEAKPEILEAIGRQLRSPRTTGRHKPSGPARHGLMQAALSQTARDHGESLGQLLAQPSGRAPRTVVRTNATIPILPLASTVAKARSLVAKGYGTLKLKVSGGRHETTRVGAVRDAVGDNVLLRVDPNGAWNDDALDRLEALEPLAIQYVEQPIPPGRPKRLLRLVERSPVPVAPDEDAASLTAIRSLLEDPLLEFIVVKPMMLGGPDLALEAVTAIEDAGAKPIITDVVESGVGRAGALHAASLTKDRDLAHGLGSGLLLSHDVTTATLIPRNGALRVPRSPGLGVRVRRLMS